MAFDDHPATVIKRLVVVAKHHALHWFIAPCVVSHPFAFHVIAQVRVHRILAQLGFLKRGSRPCLAPGTLRLLTPSMFIACSNTSTCRGSGSQVTASFSKIANRSSTLSWGTSPSPRPSIECWISKRDAKSSRKFLCFSGGPTHNGIVAVHNQPQAPASVHE